MILTVRITGRHKSFTASCRRRSHWVLAAPAWIEKMNIIRLSLPIYA
jgi:hypothetical protein